MCLITKKNSPVLIAKRNITVYKELVTIICSDKVITRSPNQRFEYDLDRLYQTDIGKSVRASYNDFEVILFLTRNYRINMHNFSLDELHKKKLEAYSYGFHSYSNIDRVKSCNGHNLHYDIYKCIIPKDSQYINGFTSLRISNQIIIKEKVN